MKIRLALPLPLLGAPAMAQQHLPFPLPPQLPAVRHLALLPLADRFWVKARSSVSIEEVAIALNLDKAHLARLNNVNEDHRFQAGDWLVLPSESSRAVKQLKVVDTSQLRRTPPLEALPEPQEPAVVRFGDSLVKIAQRYNLTLTELLHLNPGLEAARLVVGTQIRTAQSSATRSRYVIPDSPLSKSRGLSSPEEPRSGALPTLPPARLLPNPVPLRSAPPPQRFDQSLDELVRQGVLTPAERNLIRSGGDLDVGAFQSACRSGALSRFECGGGAGILWGGGRQNSNPLAFPLLAPPMTSRPLGPKDQAPLKHIRNGGHTPQWRTYGQCKYDWAGWRLLSNGTRTTAVDCGGTALRWQIRVSCDRLLVSIRSRDGSWSTWEPPSGSESRFRQGEDEMVAALCANVTGP